MTDNIDVQQQEIRHMSTTHAPDLRRHAERLSSDPHDPRIDVGQQQPRQLKTALVHDMPTGRGRPVPPRVVRLLMTPPEYRHGAATARTLA